MMAELGLIDAKLMTRIEQMTRDHEIQFGVRPDEIVLPTPLVRVNGVKISFSAYPGHSSVDHKTHSCLHHFFDEEKYAVGKR